MEKRLLILLILVFTWIPIFAVSGEYSEEKTNLSEDKGVWMIRPLATIGATYLGAFEIVYENQTVIHDKITMNAINDIGFIGENAEYIFVGLNVGPQYNISGIGLEGLYIGLYPGLFLMLESPSNNSVFLFTTMAEFGYQRIDGPVAWGGFIGYSYDSGSNSLQFKWGLKIGTPSRPKNKNST